MFQRLLLIAVMAIALIGSTEVCFVLVEKQSDSDGVSKFSLFLCIIDLPST